MQRRDFLALAATTSLIASAAGADDAPMHHDHMANMPGMTMDSGGEGHRYDALIAPYQACTTAVAACIAHCQRLLANGDKSVGRCLRTALDCDVVCNAVVRAAGLNSDYTPALAKVSVDAMSACVEACKPHIEHHAECKHCYDACQGAIAAAQKLT